MDTSNEDKYKKAFPPEFAHIGEKVQAAKERIQLIDEQIKNVPNDKGYRFILKPIGAPEVKQPTKEEIVADYERQKKDLVIEVKAYSEAEIKNSDPKTAKSVRDNVDHLMDLDNPYSELDMEELKGHGKQTKEPEMSERYFNSLRFNQQMKKETPKLPEKGKEEVETNSTAVRFAGFVSYSKELTEPEPAGGGNSLEKSKDIEPDKD